MLFVFYPHTFDKLAYEDGVVENLSAIALVLASIAMLAVGFKKIGRKAPFLMSVAILAGFVFFIIGMEEISWGQRVLEVETNEFFLEHNMQNEMNLHNLNTHLSETIYYFGAFLMLIVMPFFREGMKKLLRKVNLEKLKPLLPSAWLVVPFAVIAGFVKTSSYDQSIFTLIPAITTPAILICILAVGTKKYDAKTLVSALISLIVVTTGLVMFSLYDYSSNSVRNWTATEWKELFIALGLLIYAVDLYLRPEDIKSKLPLRQSPTSA